MLRFAYFWFVVIALGSCQGVSNAQAQSSDGIEWQTDIQSALELAKSKRLPLVVYVFRADENGLPPFCRALEAGALSSREFQLYGQSAVFVRLNGLLDDREERITKLLKQTKIALVPSVNVLEYRDDAVSPQDPIVGDVPALEFVRQLRGRLIEAALAIHSQGKSASTDAEFAHALQEFRPEYRRLQQECAVAHDARRQLLKKLSDTGEFQLDALQAADRARTDTASRLLGRLLSLAEVQLPEVQAFCRAEIEFHTERSDQAVLLQYDLMALTSDGRLPGPFAVTLARIEASQSERRVEQELAKLTQQCERAANKMDERYQSIVE